MKLEDKFSTSECQRLRERMERKRLNAQKRGIEYTLEESDWYMFGEKLLGIGTCDYTDLPFSKFATSGKYPTIERIDNNKGYVRGNIAIVSLRANKMKDFFVDKMAKKESLQKDNLVTLQRADGKWLAPMFINTQTEKLEELKLRYIPKGDEMAIRTDDKDTLQELEPLVAAKAALAEPEPEQPTVEAPVSQPQPIKEKDKPLSSLPPDVRVSSAYVRWANAYAGIGLEFKLTFAQFKAVFCAKTCAFTRELVPDAEKVLLILDRSLPVEAGNVVVTTDKFARALNNVLDQTGGSVASLAKAFKKFA